MSAVELLLFNSLHLDERTKLINYSYFLLYVYNNKHYYNITLCPATATKHLVYGILISSPSFEPNVGVHFVSLYKPGTYRTAGDKMTVLNETRKLKF